MPRPFIVVSGAPGTGKTTLGRALAAPLGLPTFDKDDILESLFDGLEVTGPEWRTRLSRASDVVLERLANSARGGVLVSFWHLAWMPANSGTPTDWLHNLPGDLVEVHCTCSPHVAAERFRHRNRHADHLDQHRDSSQLDAQIAAHIEAGPIGLEQVITVETDQLVDVAKVIGELRRFVSTHDHGP